MYADLDDLQGEKEQEGFRFAAGIEVQHAEHLSFCLGSGRPLSYQLENYIIGVMVILISQTQNS